MAENLLMEIQSLLFGSSYEKLCAIGTHCKIEVEDKSKMALAKLICESMEAKLAKLSPGEIVPYLQELKFLIMDGKLQEVAGIKAETPSKVSENKTESFDKLLCSSAFRRQFKIHGQIGEAEQKDKLSYTSLARQIQSGINQGYTKEEIVDGIIRSITPGMVLRRYLESYSDLTLERLKNILKSHYGVKNTTELYQSLAAASQDHKESPQAFLMRTLDLRQQILFACFEGEGGGINYDPKHVQSLFLRSVETGLQDESIRAKIRPYLEDPDVTDETLIQKLNQAVSAESERQKKLKGSSKAKPAVVASVSTPPNDPLASEKSSPEKKCRSREDHLMACLQAIQSEVAGLRQKMEHQSLSRDEKRGKHKRGCKKCEDNKVADQCDHCFHCGSSEHWSRGCRQRRKQDSGNYRRLPPRDRE